MDVENDLTNFSYFNTEVFFVFCQNYFSLNVTFEDTPSLYVWSLVNSLIPFTFYHSFYHYTTDDLHFSSRWTFHFTYFLQNVYRNSFD